MPTVSFRITGEFLTKHARDLATEGAWDGALKFLTDSLDGIPYKLVIEILNGNKKLVGMNDSIDSADDDDKEYKQLLSWQYGGLFRPGIHQAAYRPYAYVTGWGPDDANYACRTAGGAAPTMFSPHKNKWYHARSMFYADNKDTDIAVDGLNLQDKSYVTVLFEKLPSVPVWVTTYLEPQLALTAYLEHHTLEERGAHKLRDEDAPHMLRYKELAKVKSAPDAIEPADVGLDFKKLPPEIIAMAAEIASPEAITSLLAQREGDPPVLQGGIEQRNGWATPDGLFYTCLYNEHVALSRVLWLHLGNPEAADYEQAAEAAGWAKIRSGGFIGQAPSIELVKQPTDEQRQMFARWCRRHEVKFKDTVKVHEVFSGQEETGASGHDSVSDHANDPEDKKGD